MPSSSDFNTTYPFWNTTATPNPLKNNTSDGSVYFILAGTVAFLVAAGLVLACVIHLRKQELEKQQRLAAEAEWNRAQATLDPGILVDGGAPSSDTLVVVNDPTLRRSSTTDPAATRGSCSDPEL